MRRTCWEPCSRSRRSPPIVREAEALVPGRRGPVGRRGADRPARDADRLAGVPRATRRFTGRPAPAHSTLARAATASSGPGAKGEPAATRRARLSRRRFLIFSKGARPTCWESPDWPRGSPGSPSAGPTACGGTRSSLLQQVVDWARDSDGWTIAGRWDPATHVGALSLITPARACATRPGRDPRHQLRYRRPARSALCPLYPPRTRHVSRRHPAAEPRPVHHARRHRCVRECTLRDHRGGRLS